MKQVNVLWFTARSTTDLCATTQRALIDGLLERGCTITLYNQNKSVDISHERFTHIPFPNKARRGLQSRTLGKAMQKWLEANPQRDAVALVEWRVAGWGVPKLKRQGIPWALIDRSPPADTGLLARLQWRGWRRAWKSANLLMASGLVVSPAHKDFVERRTGHPGAVAVQAGVDTELFRPNTPKETFTMVYHGRLDRHRGLLACAMLAQKARTEGLEVDMMFIGEGDLFSALERLANANDFIHVHKPMNQEELAPLLGSCHLGLLPMPKRTAWMLASPLKRSEFLASGLPVFGIDHQGHRLAGVNSDWFTLAPQEDFHADGLEVLQRHLNTERQHSTAARAYAKEHLSWSVSVDALMGVLVDLHQSES